MTFNLYIFPINQWFHRLLCRTRVYTDVMRVISAGRGACFSSRRGVATNIFPPPNLYSPVFHIGKTWTRTAAKRGREISPRRKDCQKVDIYLSILFTTVILFGTTNNNYRHFFRNRGSAGSVRGAKRHRTSRDEALDDMMDEDDFTMPAPEEPPYAPEKWYCN